MPDLSSIHISPVCWLCSVLLFQTHWSAWMMCSIPDAIYAITSDTDMLNAPYSLFARYSLCTIMGSAMQRSTIIVQDNMLNGERPLPSRNRLCFQPTIASSAAIHILFTSLFHILWTLSNTSSSDKIAWFFLRYSNPSLTWPSYNLLWVATYFYWYQICLLADKWWRVQEKNNGNNAVMTMELQVQEKEKWPSVNFHLREVIKKNGKKAVRLTAWGGGGGAPPPLAWPLLFCENVDPFYPL